VVWTTLVADLETPVSAMLKLADGRPLQLPPGIGQGGAIRGRYSMIGTKPDLIWRCRGNGPRSTARPLRRCVPAVPDRPRWTPARRLAESRIDLPPGLPPMAAGLVGYMGYDMVRLVERLPDGNPDPSGCPMPAAAADAHRRLRQHQGHGDRGDAGLGPTRK
jgi:anthranilate synthase component I